MVVSCLLINLYLPTDYRSADATERFKDVLGEIVGFISSTVLHFVVVAGDWNTDLWQPGEFTDAVCSFLRELNLSLVDLCFPDSVGFTYLGHDGSKSWLDHIAVSNCFCSSVVSVHSIRGGKNLSDHNPLAFSLDLSTPVAPCTTSTPDCPSVRCHLATSEDICRYQQAVQCSLVSLSSLLPNHVVLCREPYCNARRGLHQACFLT